MRVDDELARLNESQLAAVMHLGSPLLILAGPGSGKTRVITLKISWLIKELQVNPHNILAITFTNKAAKEMKERVHLFTEELHNKKEGAYFSKPFISTFHSCGAYLLRKFYEEANVSRNFQIYDSAEQLVLLKEANPKVPSKRLTGIMQGISKAKDYGLTPQDSEEELSKYIFEDIECYKNYEILKTQTGNLDFGDLLIKPYQLMEQNIEVKNHIKNIWKWYFVDEYQDTNTIQSRWLYSLCQHSANLAVVGDDDQSIYGFRGAIIENILNFEKVFNNTKVITLGQNYRSTPQIVSLANNVIANNSGRHRKTIFSEEGEGTIPKVLYFQDELDEEQYVVEQSLQAQRAQESLAVFYRVNSQSRGYEMALQKAQVPYDIASLGFFDRLEIKDAIALMRLYKNANDIISFLRIANKPARGIGKTTLTKIAEVIKQGKSWYSAWRILQAELSKKAIEGLQLLEVLLEIPNTDLGLEESTSEECSTLGNVLRKLLENSRLYYHFEEEDEKMHTDRIDNVEELISYAMDYNNDEEGWQTFFEQIGLNEGGATNQSSDKLKVQLTTLHRAKGLEFDRVIICGLEEGLIPMTGMLSYNTEDIEEERRILYIGITRAKTQLALSCCNTRRRYGKTETTIPSPFLEDFDKNLVEWISKVNVTSSNDWSIGDRVRHSVYGMGYIRNVNQKNTLVAIHVEFDNEYEASFIPKYSSEIEKL